MTTWITKAEHAFNRVDISIEQIGPGFGIEILELIIDHSI